MDLSAEIGRALADGGADLLPLDGVNGIDIGLDDSGALAVRVLVSHPEDPPAELPNFLGGLPVMVVYGSPYLEGGGVVPDAVRHDPVLGGYQLGRRETPGGLSANGTLGCVLHDSTTGQPVAISNAHVLCGTPGTPPYALGDVIQQPAPSTVPPSSQERMGELLRWAVPTDPAFYTVPVLSGLGGFYDAAVCSITNRGVKVGEVADLGTVTGFATAQLGEQVYKRGARTRVSAGRVAGISGVYAVYDDEGDLVWWTFGQLAIDVDTTDPAANPGGLWSNSGDSGSVVLNRNREIVGLHHAGDNTTGYACDFPSLAAVLGVTL
jgi:hypothetical protein